MSFVGAAIPILALLAGDNVPPELRMPRNFTFDPALPDVLRPIVERASEAELDPKRGLGNALEIIKAERPKYAEDPELKIALDLRYAALVLRNRFVNNEKVALPQRWEQALSTFSRLDLTEPGLKAWLDRTIARHPDAKFQAQKDRMITIALLSRGGLDRQRAFLAFERPFQKLGFGLRLEQGAEAPFVLKIGAEEALSQSQDVAVRVTLDLEAHERGQVVWQESLYRTMRAKSPDVALERALDWIVRIGGRELFFRWLAGAAFPFAQLAMPSNTPPPKVGPALGATRPVTPNTPSEVPHVHLPTTGRTEPAPPAGAGPH